MPLPSRYWDVLRSSWQQRHAMDVVGRPRYELEFMPAQLELMHTPPHPVPWWTLRMIVCFSMLVLLWACVGKLDIVAVARGTLVPSGETKEIQSLETARIRRIPVHDGQHVKAGDVLLELESDSFVADLEKARAAAIDARLDIARAHSLLEANGSDVHLDETMLTDVAQARASNARKLAQASYAEYARKLASASEELIGRISQRETKRRDLQKVERLASLSREVADSYRALSANQYVSRVEFLQKQQAYLDQSGQARMLQSQIAELDAAIAAQQQSVQAQSAGFRREQLDALTKAQASLAQAQQDELKARDRLSHTVLKSPVDGTVTGLKVHTLGGVVTQASTVMEVVPGEKLLADVVLKNDDAGFVRPGLPAVIKIDAYPYTHYGTVTGRVLYVSRDSVPDKEGRRDYVMRVATDKNTLGRNGELLALAPGMSVSAEVKTGQRTVIQYFLGPLVQSAGDALRER